MLTLRRLQYAAGLLALTALIATSTPAQSPPVDFVLLASSAIQAEIVPCG